MHVPRRPPPLRKSRSEGPGNSFTGRRSLLGSNGKVQLVRSNSGLPRAGDGPAGASASASARDAAMRDRVARRLEGDSISLASEDSVGSNRVRRARRYVSYVALGYLALATAGTSFYSDGVWAQLGEHAGWEPRARAIAVDVADFRWWKSATFFYARHVETHKRSFA